jgi:hypothetical protein
MVMGDKMWTPGKGWRKALGLVPGIAVIPHHATLASRWDVLKMRQSLPRRLTLAGVDEATALAGPPWQVLGTGRVTLYPAKPSRQAPPIFIHGQEVAW